VFSSLNMVRALRRNEVVAIQLDRPMDADGTRPVPFFGARELARADEPGCGPIPAASLRTRRIPSGSP